ncbi:MRM3 methyltransferase, partial [Amia calva]|nr:MRM3 methyltransferase [Amia calva]
MAALVRSVSLRVLAAESRTFLAGREKALVDVKRYVRALRRNPVKVLYPGNDTDQLLKSAGKPRDRGHPPATDSGKNTGRGAKREKPQSQGSSVPRHGAHSQAGLRAGERLPPAEHVRSSAVAGAADPGDELDGLRYEKAFPGDKRLARVVCVARSRTFREKQGKVLLEGRRLICDALAAGALPQTLFFSSMDQLRTLPLDKLRRASFVKVKFEDIKIWSDLVTPQGVIAIFSRPEVGKLVFPQQQEPLPLSLICDNIRDPGNVGTILRCAAAAGCQRVLLTRGCVDVWEPKVLRAAMGAHFRVPIVPSLHWEEVPNYLSETTTVHLADNCSTAPEGPEEAEKPPAPPRKAGDYGWVSNRPNPRRSRYEEYAMESDSDSDSDSEEEDRGARLTLPAVESHLYHQDWTGGHTALVIGGETHGLSLEALLLAEKTDGRRLLVPMAEGVDSLNSAMAASILVFEAKRQLTERGRQAGWKQG